MSRYSTFSGYRPDPYSEADKLYAFNLLGLKAAPSEHTLEFYLGEALTQGGLGSCVAQAVAKAIWASHAQNPAVGVPKLASRLAIYYLARATHGMTKWDSGTHIRAAFQILNRFGFAVEELWPYTDSKQVVINGLAKFQMMPPTRVFRGGYDQALKNKPAVYRRILESGYERVDQVKEAIYAGFPVIFGTQVSKTFRRDAAIGHVLDPPTGNFAGGHAMVIGAYTPHGAHVLNSWGKDFGNNGWVWLSWDYIAAPITRDLWTVRHAPPYSG
jgi:hypothetical protein